ncbi:MAG TPA: hypothetical protein VGZ71_00710, partial [Puia sp.]|nr:hypothetical protein [Puia sp.]
FFTGVSTVGTAGSRYFDIELYKNNFSYNSSTGVFTSAGPDAGHTQWKFDASGNIIQTGDMIVAVNFVPGTAPVVDVRIWVSQTTFSTVTPAYFNFGPNFDGATPAFGYASILSKAGATNFGSGISNYSLTPAQDTTYSTPWGTENSSKIWATQYQSLQFIEVGLNLTRIGVDPALYTAYGLSACQSLFSDIFFKSRASNSFVSDMHDFVTPLQFLRTPVMDYSLRPDTLRCNRPIGTIQITNNTTIGNYSWQTLSGNISSSNTDSSQININKPGTYIVSASAAQGCPATRKDTVIIPIDTLRPVASIFAAIGPNYSYLQFYGGDTIASNRPTVFGGSKGLLWNWSGPAAFSSTIQNPVTDTVWGTYRLIVTEKRNGCKDTAVKTLSYYDFAVLAGRYLRLSGTLANNSIFLKWQDLDQSNTNFYIIEKSLDGIEFNKIGIVYNSDNPGPGASKFFSFTDYHPNYGDNFYRIQSIAKDGQASYSNIFKLTADLTNQEKFYLIRSYTGNGVALVANTDKEYRGTLLLYNIAGQLLQTKNIQLSKGLNKVELPMKDDLKNSVIIVSLLINNQPTFSQKTIL